MGVGLLADDLLPPKPTDLVRRAQSLFLQVLAPGCKSTRTFSAGPGSECFNRVRGGVVDYVVFGFFTSDRERFHASLGSDAFQLSVHGLYEIFIACIHGYRVRARKAKLVFRILP